VRLAVFGRFSPVADATVAAIADAAAARGHDVVRLDIAVIITGPVALDPTSGAVVIGGAAVDLADVDAMFLGPLPSAWARVTPPGEDPAASIRALDERRVAQASRASVAWSVALIAEALGVAVVSSPSRARPYDHKPFQMAALARAGLRIPRTRVGDHDDVAGDGDVVSKPVVGGPVDVGALHRAGRPMLVQERLRGRQLRLAVVDGVVVAAGAIDLDDDELAMSVDVRRSDKSWSPLVVDDRLAHVGGAAAACCCFDLCAIDMIDEHGGGGLVVVDVNRTPQLLDLQDDCGADIVGAAVDLLERRGASRAVRG
jgi:glutathione synthase/RimK-type ligase-like ATP-grasp enzyme